MKNQIRVLILTCLSCMLIGFVTGFMWGWYYSYHPKIKPTKPRTGYTVIDYDSVEWSDGKREKYNWHVHTKKYRSERLKK